MNAVGDLIKSLTGKKEAFGPPELTVMQPQALADAAKLPVDQVAAGGYREGVAQAGGAAKRHFTVAAARAGKTAVRPGGAYRSHDPLAAAKKAAKQLFDKAPKTVRKIVFSLRETTRGSDKRQHDYVAVKHKLAKPVALTYGDRVVHVHHRYDVRAA